jgi:hypothetical protein
MYVTLMVAQYPCCEVLCEKSTSYRGSALFRCTTTSSGVSTPDNPDRRPAYSHRYSESLSGRMNQFSWRPRIGMIDSWSGAIIVGRGEIMDSWGSCNCSPWPKWPRSVTAPGPADIRQGVTSSAASISGIVTGDWRGAMPSGCGSRGTDRLNAGRRALGRTCRGSRSRFGRVHAFRPSGRPARRRTTRP